MPDVNLPLSGPVAQWFQFLTSVFAPFSGQIGFINVNLGRSSNPTVEKDVVSEVASYGKQLGRIEDGLVVLLKYLPRDKLEPKETKAVEALERMLNDIADVRDRYAKQPVIRPVRHV